LFHAAATHTLSLKPDKMAVIHVTDRECRDRDEKKIGHADY